MMGGRRQKRLGLFVYFVAGSVSLAMELLSFYAFQATAGSLYSQLAVLVGAFMLGLSLGAWYASRTDRPGVEYLALVTLLAAGLIFMFTHDLIDVRLGVLYHPLFLFTVALATGSLFTSATRRYYGYSLTGNRGLGYAIELAGSGLSALLVTTVLLPLIGLEGVFICLLSLVALTLSAAGVSNRGD